MMCLWDPRQARTVCIAPTRRDESVDLKGAHLRSCRVQDEEGQFLAWSHRPFFSYFQKKKKTQKLRPLVCDVWHSRVTWRCPYRCSSQDEGEDRVCIFE